MVNAYLYPFHSTKGDVKGGAVEERFGSLSTYPTHNGIGPFRSFSKRVQTGFNKISAQQQIARRITAKEQLDWQAFS